MNYLSKKGTYMKSSNKNTNLSDILNLILEERSVKEGNKNLNEEKGPSGQTWEALISVALTNPKNPEKLPEWKAAAQWWSNETIKKQSLALANSFKKEFKIQSLSQLGNTRGKLSSNWIRWGGSNSTPKTDVISGNYHISLKKKGGSQLVSGLAGEMQATFNAAKETIGGDSALSRETIEWIDNLGSKMVKLGYKGYVKDLDDLEKIEPDLQDLSPRQQDWIKEKNDLRKQNKELTKDLERFFQNENFKKAFCFEAVTGTKKFASKDAVANQLVEFDPETGVLTKKIPVRTLNSVSNMAATTKFYFSFKTSSGQSAVAIRSSAAKFMNDSKIPTLREMILDEYFSMDESVKTIVENRLNESSTPLNEISVMGIINNLKDKASDVAPKVKNAIVNFFKNLAEKVMSAIESIKKLGKNMIDGLLEFLGIEVVLKDVKGEVNNWW